MKNWAAFENRFVYFKNVCIKRSVFCWHESVIRSMPLQIKKLLNAKCFSHIPSVDQEQIPHSSCNHSDEHYSSRNPYSLSDGQNRRTACGQTIRREIVINQQFSKSVGFETAFMIVMHTFYFSFFYLIHFIEWYKQTYRCLYLWLWVCSKALT